MTEQQIKELTERIAADVISIFQSRGLLEEENKLSDAEIEKLTSQLDSISMNSKDISKAIKKHGHAPLWTKTKISNASDMMAKVRSYMISEIDKSRSVKKKQ